MLDEKLTPSDKQAIWEASLMRANNSPSVSMTDIVKEVKEAYIKLYYVT